MKRGGPRRRRLSVRMILFASVIFTGLGLVLLTLHPVDPESSVIDVAGGGDVVSDSAAVGEKVQERRVTVRGGARSCATVEEMGSDFEGGFAEQSLRVRQIARRHFHANGALAIRELPPKKFCWHGFVLGKTAEAGFGNEMYKILTYAALSIMLNRSLIIGQTRGKYPFGDYIAYSNATFTMSEVKHLWRQKGCLKKYGRRLVVRMDDFEKPSKSNVLCSNWMKWKQPVIWFQGTTDAVAAQFFLKNVHKEMRVAAFELFGESGKLETRANVFGELMMALISPTEDVNEAVNWVLRETGDPDVSLHMRMLNNRPVRALRAAMRCLGKAIRRSGVSNPRVAIVSDTPSVVNAIDPNIRSFAKVIHFDYKLFQGDISRGGARGLPMVGFRKKDWGPAPRWVAFVDFFLAARAKHAVISVAQRRVGTTYAQLVAALAAAKSVKEEEDGWSNSSSSSFVFLSCFQRNLLTNGLKNQVGWGHVWNRFAGPLSCPKQPDQCAFTPLMAPGWWDSLWQSPIPRDVRRMAAFGVKLSGFGTSDDGRIRAFCRAKKEYVNTVTVI
ncbi:PREDICTED: uncharacterized protein LOC104805319 isoform X2 [Tarenaya hassleriana]|uniref:uncharacterized protein LOC104805319 isoform X2 n=1 Tax=Tarenaya hassleriana TaxID=28532 RepID=UPI00053C7952|nr:PREDICTED: uncharacterized protein LOC104805319 isoform X2 [Tarenaya hassleriana]